MGARQLAKHHGHELGPTTKAAGVTLRFMVGDEALKLRSWKQFQKLAENAGESNQGDTFTDLAFFSGNCY
jgi:hypothetical protein